MSEKTIPVSQHHEALKVARLEGKASAAPFHVPDSILRLIVAFAIALGGGSLGWSFSISQRVSAVEATQQTALLDIRNELNEINQRLDAIQARQTQGASYSASLAPSAAVRFTLEPHAATHPIKAAGGPN